MKPCTTQRQKQALVVLAAGTGALAVEIAKVKEAFGGNESGQQPAPVEQQPASPEQS